MSDLFSSAVQCGSKVYQTFTQCRGLFFSPVQCGGKECQNDGELDVNNCTCLCKGRLTGDTCGQCRSYDLSGGVGRGGVCVWGVWGGWGVEREKRDG